MEIESDQILNLVGIQVPPFHRVKFDSESEMGYSYFNGIELWGIDGSGIKIPDMQWNFTFGYAVNSLDKS